MVNIKKSVALVAIFSSFVYGNYPYGFIPCGVTRNGIVIPQDSPECLELTVKYYEQFPRANIPSDKPKQTLDEQIKAVEAANEAVKKRSKDYNKKMQEKFGSPQLEGLEKIKKAK